jgi:predicted secreted Zn-dependent protease
MKTSSGPVPVAEMNYVYPNPPTPAMGQVAESWSSIQAMLADDGVVSYGLIWLADILRAIVKASVGLRRLGLAVASAEFRADMP